MNRIFVAAVVTAIATVALPALASDHPPESQVTSQVSVAPSIGAPLPAVVARGVILPKGEAVSGEVVMSTPAELVIHTTKGLQTFEITPQTQMLVGASEGEDVTITFRPAGGSVSGTAAGNHTKAADLALAVVPRVASVTSR
jgi:hypothetical protein